MEMDCNRIENSQRQWYNEMNYENNRYNSMIAVVIFALYQIIKYELNHEKIICPECGQIQYAKIKHTMPFDTYIHECKRASI